MYRYLHAVDHQGMTTTAQQIITYSDGSPRCEWAARLTDADLRICLARHGGPALETARLEAALRQDTATEYGRLPRGA